MCAHSLSAVKIPYTLLRDYCGICGPHVAPEVISEHNIVICYIKRARGCKPPNPHIAHVCCLYTHTHQCTQMPFMSPNLNTPFQNSSSTTVTYQGNMVFKTTIYYKFKTHVWFNQWCQLACSYMATIWGQYCFQLYIYIYMIMTNSQDNEEHKIILSSKQLNCTQVMYTFSMDTQQ